MLEVSVLQQYSYGMVAEANPDQSRTIKVKILEQLASQYGTPDSLVDVITTIVKTFGGKERITTCNFKDWVPANWLNRASATISPPKVVVGQRVLLWRVGDSRQFYWEELDVDMRLKQDEHLVIAINNKNDGERLDEDNAYMVEYSTVNQRIRLRTNRNNGELAAYDINLCGKEGYLRMMDDCAMEGDNYNGNGVLIDSVNTKVTIQNISGTNYILDKEDIFVNCKGNRTSVIGGTDKVTAKDMVDSVSSTMKMGCPSIAMGGGTMSIAANLSIGAAASVANSPITALIRSRSANTITIQGTSKFIGNTSFTGTTTYAGAATFGAATTFLKAVIGTSSTWSVSCDYPGK